MHSITSSGIDACVETQACRRDDHGSERTVVALGCAGISDTMTHCTGCHKEGEIEGRCRLHLRGCVADKASGHVGYELVETTRLYGIP